MTNGNWPGLVGRTLDFLCNVRGVDTGLGLGGALDVVARLAAGRYAAPFVGLGSADSTVARAAGIDVRETRDRTSGLEFDRIDWGATLIGPEEDCKCVIAAAEDLLADFEDDPPLVGAPVWPAPKPTRRGRLSYWSDLTQRPWFIGPGDGLDTPVLIGASGVHRDSVQEQPGLRSELLRDLRAITDTGQLVVVEMDPPAREMVRDITHESLRRIALCGEPGPALRRWMFVLTVVAIGVDPRRPLITEDLLEPAAWVGAGAHSLILMSFGHGRRPRPSN
jgi:hypothetical protein